MGGGERRTERAWRRVRTGSAGARAAIAARRDATRETRGREKERDRRRGSETDASDRDGGRYIRREGVSRAAASCSQRTGSVGLPTARLPRRTSTAARIHTGADAGCAAGECQRRCC